MHSKNRSASLTLQLTGFVLLFAAACASRVLVPPRIDLHAYEAIGLVVFSCNAEGNLNEFATQKFMESLLGAQPGIAILELGDKDQILESVEGKNFSIEIIKAVARKHHVDALILGHLDVTDVKPKVQLSTLLQSASIEAEVEASLTARLYGAHDGATRWTDSARRRETIAYVGLGSNQPFYFDAADPDKAYGELIYGLVRDITSDYRPRYERK
jgi:hypothetical protein